MRALTISLADPLRRLRHTVATATERLRALDLPAGDADTARQVACIALSALSTTLFVGGDTTSPRVPADLVADEIHQIAGLLDIALDAVPDESACVCLSRVLPPDRGSVSP
jgi:hypothetical protein